MSISVLVYKFFGVFTWKLETLAVSKDSLHPVAAVGKRLLTGQVEHQAQQRQLPPLWKEMVGGDRDRQWERHS